MGTKADLLASLGANGTEWRIDNFTRLEQEMIELRDKVFKIRENPGWTGQSAQDAKQTLHGLELHLDEVEAKIKAARTALDTANDLRVEAAKKYASLPDGDIPWPIQPLLVGLVAGSTVVIPGVGTFLAEIAVNEVKKYFGAEREAAAQVELEALKQNLEAPRGKLVAARLSTAEWPEAPEPPAWPPAPTVWPGDSNGNGGWSTGGVTGGSGSGGGGFGGGTYVAPHNFPKPEISVCGPYPWDPEDIDGPTLSVDSDGSGFSGGGGAGSFMSGGGLGSGLAGGGAGAGALGIGAKLAAGGLGGGASLLGGGAGLAGSGAGAGAGGKSSAMMGGAPGGAGGGGDKEKRSGLGLIAPKLEDDEETGPRSAAAGAGGRD